MFYISEVYSFIQVYGPYETSMMLQWSKAVSTVFSSQTRPRVSPLSVPGSVRTSLGREEETPWERDCFYVCLFVS